MSDFFAMPDPITAAGLLVAGLLFGFVLARLLRGPDDFGDWWWGAP